MSDRVQLRSATADDLAAMLQIAAESPSAPQWTAAQYRTMLAAQPEQQPLQRSVMVAAVDGVTVGFAVASALCTVSPAEVELESIVVAPGHRKHGIGACLLDAVVAWACARRGHCLRLEVRASNHVARRFYERHAFVQQAVRPRYYTQPLEDALCLERALFQSPPTAPMTIP